MYCLSCFSVDPPPFHDSNEFASPCLLQRFCFQEAILAGGQRSNMAFWFDFSFLEFYPWLNKNNKTIEAIYMISPIIRPMHSKTEAMCLWMDMICFVREFSSYSGFGWFPQQIYVSSHLHSFMPIYLCFVANQLDCSLLSFTSSVCRLTLL